jgi:hypothetical protein
MYNLRRIEGWLRPPASDGWLSTVKPQLAKVKMFDEHINDTDGVVLNDIIFQIFGKQCASHSVITFNEPFHLSSSSSVALALFYWVFNWEALNYN